MHCARSLEREEQLPCDFTIELAHTIGVSEERGGITERALVRSVFTYGAALLRKPGATPARRGRGH